MAAPADAKSLLIEIARCPNVRLASKDESHPCRRVVAAQGLPRSRHQLPEPWGGHIETAPILFVSSNPSFNDSENPFPRWGWADDKIEMYFTTRFDGTFRSVHYWTVVRAIARDVLDREPLPGHDYAITELVRCKSLNEEGAWAALETCSSLYLERTLKVAGAKVVIALGKMACESIASQIGGTSEIGLRRGTFNLGGRKRAVLMLAKPSAFGGRKKPTHEEAQRLRAVLQER
jgi:uracil-DNA glycosylase